MQGYPVPQKTGGTLIREAVRRLRLNDFKLPFTSHILIAVSGGPDSIALAHLLSRYGRRVVPREKIILLHLNHNWRGDSSSADARFVENFAKKMDLRLISENLPGPTAKQYQGRSWEDAARELRKSFYQRKQKEFSGPVLTAHHGDDLAETLLWRLFTGNAKTHGGGIAFSHGGEIRPFLGVRKSMLLDYLREERQRFRVDATNFEGRFLRARIRNELVPRIEKLFPKAVEHLIRLGLEAQENLEDPENSELDHLREFFGALSIRPRRQNWEGLSRGATRMDLPGGWAIQKDRKNNQDRWVLTKAKAQLDDNAGEST